MASVDPAHTDGQSAKNDFDVRGTLRLLVRQKWVILGAFCTVVSATIFVTLSLPKVYEATATLEYDPSPPRPLGNDVEDVAIPTGNFLASKEWYQTQNTIIASRTIALKVVDRLVLHRDPDFMQVAPDERANWTGATRDEAASRLIDSLKVKQERETRVARVEVQSRNPKRAALLANSIADAYMDWMMEERLGSTVRAVEWLSGQLDDVSRRLEVSEHSLYDFRRKNNVLSISLADQQNGIAQTINNLNTALTETVTRKIQIEAKVRQFEAALRDNPMEVHSSLLADNRAISDLRTLYHEALVERDSLSMRYGANHPEMQRIQGKIDTLVAAVRSEITGLLDSVQAELREVQDVERGIRQAKQQTQNIGLDLNLHEIDYKRLERQRANNEKLHSLLLQRTTETNLTRLLRVSPIRLVDRAVVSNVPVRPRPLLNLALGSLFGLLTGFGLAVLRARMDRTVTVPDDVTAAGTTLLGLVPGIMNDKGGLYGGSYGRRLRRTRRDAAADESKDLVVHTHPRSAVAECCRTIRTNLAFMSPDKPVRTMVITSPGPSEGKSTLAISLGVTLAQSGRRVLLVDTDLRRPRLHRAFRAQGLLGVTSVLAGERALDECIQSTVVEGLSLLPCGPIPPNPSELLHSASFARLLKEMRERFDFILLDSPPVGMVIDAAIIGPQADGAVMIAKSGRTTRDALSHSVRQMLDVGSNVLGCVLNEVDLSRHGEYAGYYYYRGGYTYGTDPGKGSDGSSQPPTPSGAPHAAE